MLQTIREMRRRVDFKLLFVLSVICISIWGFVELSGIILSGEKAHFDESILLSMRSASDVSDPIGPGWVEEMGRDITALGGNVVLTLLTVFVLGYLMIIRRPVLCFVLVLATVGALAASTLLKQSFDRDRPDLVPHHSRVYTASFPSGHAMLSASTYLTMGALLARAQKRRRLKVYIIAVSAFLSLIVGISRVYLGVHWPSDVLAGWAAGTAWALGCWWLADVWLRRKEKRSDLQNSHFE